MGLNEAIVREHADRKLADAIAATGRVDPESARQLATLWSEDFSLVEDGSRTALSARTGRPVDEEIAARLASPAYGRFVKPATPGERADASLRRIVGGMIGPRSAPGLDGKFGG